MLSASPLLPLGMPIRGKQTNMRDIERRIPEPSDRRILRRRGRRAMTSRIKVGRIAHRPLFLKMQTMTEEKARIFAAQSVLGAAKLALESDESLEQLRINVCSPKGTTIEAVRVLEEKGFRSAVIEAQKACVKKAKGL